jgi:general secretion pathway protein L
MARRILGLDVGSHSVKAVELRQTLRSLEVVQLRQLPLDDPAPALAHELREWVRMHDLPHDGVIAALAGDRVSARRLQFPFTDRRKISAAVPFELESQVPFDLDDFVVDWEILREGDGQTEVAATLAPHGEVAVAIETLDDAELTTRVVEAEGLVLANVANLVELPGVRLLADVGHRKTTLCLCVDGRPLAARTVPIAGQALTAAIARERGLGEVEAERVKIERGVVGGASGEAAVEVLDRLSRELVRTIGSLEPVLEGTGQRIDAIDLLGGTAHLHRLDEYLGERTGIRTERLPLPSGELGAAFLAAGDPLLYAPAMALALRGSSMARTRMNFRQGEWEQRLDLSTVTREMRWPAIFAGAALALGVVSIGTDIVLQNQSAERREQEAVTLSGGALGGAPSGNPVAAMQSAVRGAQKRADTLGVYRGNLSALDILTEISGHVPADLDVVFEELSIDRQVVQIKGHAPSFSSVERLGAELSEYAPFSEITLGDVTRDGRRGGQNFSVRISLSIEGES